MLRDLKAKYGYALGEQEEMYPFEREILLHMLHHESLEQANVPAQGWTQYAKDIGATKPTAYRKDFKVIDYER